jgi:hypothetical protein
MKYLQLFIIWVILVYFAPIFLLSLLIPYFTSKDTQVRKQVQRSAWAGYKELWKYKTFTEER